MIDEKQQDAAGTARSFFSLAALRDTHLELLQRQQHDPTMAAMQGAVEAFLERGRMTGALLAERDERRAAQSLLDYWVTAFYRAGLVPPDTTLLDFDASLAPTLPDEACPYLGLDAFHEADADRFFGRHRIVAEMLQRIERLPMLVVLGPSGSGKSSLVRAGLLPALKRGAISGSEHWHYCQPIVPGSDPIMALARASRPAEASTGAWRRQHFAKPPNDHRMLKNALASLTDHPSVLLIDQFEELFTLCNDDVMRQTFITNLMHFVQAGHPPNLLIITMRSDFELFLSRLGTFHRLFQATRMNVPPLEASELREAIEQPAEQVGLKFEKGVVDDLVRNLLGQPAALPLLQFSLLKLWEQRAGNRVTMASYRRIGGGLKALAISADNFYNRLMPEEQVTVRRILLRMARPGDGLEVTNRRIRQRDLVFVREDPERVHRVLEKLIAARLVHRTGGDVNDEDDVQLQIAHEALIRNWPRLFEWIERERMVLRQRQRLSSAAEEWDRLGRESAALLRGSMLATVLQDSAQIGELNRLEREYISASVLADDAERQQKAQIERQQRELAEERARRAEEELRRVASEQERLRQEERAAIQAKTNRRLRRRLILTICIAVAAVAIAALALWQQLVLQETRAALALAAQQLQTVDNDLDEARASLEDINVRLTAAAVTATSARRAAEETVAAVNATATIVQVANETAIAAGTANAQAAAIISVDSTAITDARTSIASSNQELAAAQTAVAQARTEVAPTTAALQAANAAQATAVAAQAATAVAIEIANLLLEARNATDPASALEYALQAVDRSSGPSFAIEDVLQMSIQRAITPVTHGNEVTSLMWYPAAKSDLLLSTGDDGRLRFWRVIAAPPFLEAAGPSRGVGSNISSAAWNQDGSLVATGSRSGPLRIWRISRDAGGIEVSEERSLASASGVRSLAWSPDGRRIAVSDGRSLRILDALSGQEIAEIPILNAQLSTLAWSGDGNFVVATSSQGMSIWQAETAELLSRIPPANGNFASAVWRQNRILTAGSDGSIIEWDASNVAQVIENRRYSDTEAIVRFADWHCGSEEWFIGAAEDGTAYLWKGLIPQEASASLRSGSAQSAALVMAVTLPAIPTQECHHTVTGAANGELRLYNVAYKDIVAAARRVLETLR